MFSEILRTDQQRVFDWLGDRAPQLADVYIGAIQLLADNAIAGRVQFICHAGRDLTNRIPELFAESIGRVDLTADLNELSVLWSDTGLEQIDVVQISTQETIRPEGTLADVGVPLTVVKHIKVLLDHHKQASQNHRDRAVKMVEAVAPENVGRREALLPIANQWTELSRWFHGHAHAGLKENSVKEDELQSKFLTLESQINALISEFYEPVETLDEILQDTNS